MKFRYYITNLHVGAIEGTDYESVARSFAASCEYFVVDTETGKWIAESGNEFDIQEIK